MSNGELDSANKGVMCEEEDDFEDAVEVQPLPETMTLESAIADTQIALNLFLNNKYELAKEKMESWKDGSMYHALGYGTILYIQAMMTFDAKDIETAAKQSKLSTRVCDHYRKQYSVTSQMSRFVRRINNNGCDSYSEDQIHAELCYAESLLERALLTFVEDENLSSFIKGALRVRACYNSYKECQRILQENVSRGAMHDHFESGVCMGVGAFNLLISMLPARILKLLEFVGFTGDKEFGISQLAASCNLVNGLRSPLCSLIVLAYETIVRFVLGTGDADIPLCDKLVYSLLEKYPKGSLVLYFAGRLEEIKGNLENAIGYFLESIESQKEWRQFHHLCYWELVFCYAYQREWRRSASYAEKLYNENKWSKAMYAYMTAIFLAAAKSKTSDERERIKHLFQKVPVLKQRIAGKSIPVEKFCVAKAQKYLSNENLFLAHYEVIYMWNGFHIIGQDAELVKPIVEDIEAELEARQNLDDTDPDAFCLFLLLKAVCLKYLQSPFQAQQCLIEIIKREKKLTDIYLLPNAYLELAQLYFEDKDITGAGRCLSRAKDYKGYLLESRVHFRIRFVETILAEQVASS